jgi:hypothetical protein
MNPFREARALRDAESRALNDHGESSRSFGPYGRKRYTKILAEPSKQPFKTKSQYHEHTRIV